MKYVLAIYPEAEIIKVALVSKRKKKISIELLRSFPRQTLDGGNVKPLYILQPILAGKDVSVVSGLEAEEVILRELELNITRHSAVFAALPFQLEPLLPYPLEEIIALPQLYKEGSKTRASVFATSQSVVQRHLETLDLYEIQPDSVSAAPMALLRFAEFCYPTGSLYAFHFGEKKSFFLFISEGKIKLSQVYAKGSSHFLEALRKDTGEIPQRIDLSSVDAQCYPALHKEALQLRKDLDRIHTFLKQGKEDLPYPWALSGDFSLFQIDTLFEPLSQTSQSEQQHFAIPLGLALDALLCDGRSLQFRKDVFTAPAQTQRRKKNLAIYLGATLLLALSALGGALFLVHKKENLLFQRYSSHFSEVHSRPELLKEMQKLETTLSKHKQPLAGTLAAPRASNLLLWLSTHPVLAKKEHEIDILSVRYVLVKYPKLDQSKEPYQIKVELEFTTPLPRAARAFHDALLSGDQHIDNKQEVSWKAHDHNYSTSFFLNP